MSSLFSRSKKKSESDINVPQQSSDSRVERAGSIAIPAEPRPSMVAVGSLVAGIPGHSLNDRSESRGGDRMNERSASSLSHHRAATHTHLINNNNNNNNTLAPGGGGGEDSLSTLESSMSFPSAIAPPNSTISNPNSQLPSNNQNSLPSTGGGMGMPQTIITTTVDEELSAQLVSQLGTALPPRGTRHGHLPSLAFPTTQSISSSASSAAAAQGGSSTSVGSDDSLSDTMERMKLSSANAAGVDRKSSISSSSSSSSSSSQSTNKKSKSISYAAERVIGNGSFGVVYQATVIETGETVAIKKVLQDKRFKNRELQIMGMLDHPNIVALRHCFYSRGEKNDEIFLNLVMEYIPETIHRTIRNHTKANKLLPIMYVKVYLYQMCRALVYIHQGAGICHRDIKPQNLLLNTKTHECKLCDFGSAKILMPNEPNVAYICSRYYRAPELVFEATDYSCAIDTWSLGCVFAEMLLGNPLFPGESGVDQLIEIIKVLGTPSREEIYAMNPNHTSFKFPQIKAHSWTKVFRGKAPPQAVDLVSRFLVYDPRKRLDPLEALTHPFFDELRDPNVKMPNGKPIPNLFNFTDIELKEMQRRNLTKKIVPSELLKILKLPTVPVDSAPFVPSPWDKLTQRAATPSSQSHSSSGGASISSGSK